MILIKEHEEREQTKINEVDQDKKRDGLSLNDSNETSHRDGKRQEVMVFKANLIQDEKAFFDKRKEERKSWFSELFSLCIGKIPSYIYIYFSGSFVSGISRFFFGK